MRMSLASAAVLGHRVQHVGRIGAAQILAAALVLVLSACTEERSGVAPGVRVQALPPLHKAWASYIERGAGGRVTTSMSAPARIRHVTLDGERAYALTIRASDRDRYTPTAQRTELAQGNPSKPFADGDRKMRAGEERWITEQIWIPAAAPTGDTGYGFYALNQFKVDGSGGPAAGMSFENDRLIVDRASSRAYGSTGQTDLWSSPVVRREHWLKLIWHVRWSLGNWGLIELFGDLGDGLGYRQLMPRYNGWTLKYGIDGAPGVVHPRIGIYRRAIDEDTTIYFARYSVATSRTAAEAAVGL
jgi:hypothetical protein